MGGCGKKKEDEERRGLEAISEGRTSAPQVGERVLLRRRRRWTVLGLKERRRSYRTQHRGWLGGGGGGEVDGGVEINGAWGAAAARAA